MTFDEVVQQIHRVYESDMLPLTALRSRDDVEKYTKKGYPVHCTCDEWKELHPSLDENKIFFLPPLTGTGMAYYDGEAFINMPYFLGKPMTANKNKSIEEIDAEVLRAMESQQAHIARKEYLSVMFAAPDGIQPAMLKHILANRGPSPELYNTAISVYTISETSSIAFDAELWAALAEMKSPKQAEKTAQFISRDFPGQEAVTVYRGWADGSARPEEAVSWTPDLTVAMFFAGKNGESPKYTIGKLNIEDVLEYFPTDRKNSAEVELIALPGKVKIESTHALLSPESELVNNICDKTLKMYNDYRTMLASLYKMKQAKLSDHDATHSLRVLLLALNLAEMEGLNALSKVRLAEAAIFHDYGRQENGIEASHGLASRRLYEEMGGTDPFVSCMIEAHCMNSKGIKSFVRSQDFTKKEKETLRTLIDVFMDADALDRVRFQFGTPDWLNVKMLRTGSALQFIPFAMKSVNYIRFPDEIEEDLHTTKESFAAAMRTNRLFYTVEG